MYVYNTVSHNFSSVKTIGDAIKHYSNTPLSSGEIVERFFRMYEGIDHAIIEKSRRIADELDGV